MVANVPGGGEQAGPAVEPRPQLAEPAQVRVARRRSLRVPGQQLEQPGQVVGAPLARLVGLAQPEPRPGGEPAEEPGVVDRHPNRGPRAERHLGAVGQADEERPALEPRQDSLERPHGDAVHERDAGCRLPAKGVDAHVRTDPFPGSKGGFLWNGTRLRKSLSACQWMSAITWSGISG